MTVHMSARLAWHMDGWNGHVCKNPASNVYCVGPYSYPSDNIARDRNLEHESSTEIAGGCCSKLKFSPPCIFSINAFGSKELEAFNDPPDFFHGEAQRATWPLPAATVGVWPYERMFDDSKVKRQDGTYDYDIRLAEAKDYFTQFEKNRSLVFYYSNYSNPLNQAEERRYAIVGVARLKDFGKVQYFNNCSDEIQKKYGGGFVWQLNVTSHYPDEGLRLPYHKYLDKPDVLEQFAFFPENPRLFKYGTREISDDDALGLIERFIEIAGRLKELEDKTENWDSRLKWLHKLVAELWEARGLYPGMAKVLDVLGFEQAIPFWKSRVLAGRTEVCYEDLFALIDGKTDSIKELTVSADTLKKIRRRWKLYGNDECELLKNVFPRLDLDTDQMERVLSADRDSNSVYAPLSEINDNPYVLAEQFVGNDVDDLITFTKIDHGAFPSPELGGKPWMDEDDWRRFRALCVEQLRRERKHTFVSVREIISSINHKLSFLPQWKRHQFTDKYFEVDEEDLRPALTIREHDTGKFIYWKPLYGAERAVETALRELAKRPDIKFKSPVTDEHWQNFLTVTDSPLATKAAKRYKEAIDKQIAVCQQIFRRPVAVLSGAAGTGKTTIIRAIMQAIEKAHGAGTSFMLLAPTGKAADRIREATKKQASTVHSFLASLGWLNDNLTFKKSGGQQAKGMQTFIVDEASMLDLELASTLFKAIDWNSVQRLILVGDPNQLPPIGRGKVFAELVEWLRKEQPESLAHLSINVRQMENTAMDQGTGILGLASLYLRSGVEQEDVEDTKAEAEQVLKKAQEGGDVDKDLRVVYWTTPENLAKQLVDEIVADMEKDTGVHLADCKPWELWNKSVTDPKDPNNLRKRPEYSQIMSPYRGELSGTDHINEVIQQLLRSESGNGNHPKMLDGIMLFDKVIQIRNRTKSDPLYAYDPATKQNVATEVFNGELGYVKPHGFDGAKWKWPQFKIEHFQVLFSRKENRWVGYGSHLGKGPKGWIKEQKVVENLELAYAISVHKAQGSEFDRTYLIVPKHRVALLSPEMFYTGLTRAKRHCTLFIEEDISPLIEMRRRERSHLLRINASLFEFDPLPDALLGKSLWYEDHKIYHTLAGFKVRSKSEVIIANILSNRGLEPEYETPLFADDGTFYLPDFTITWKGEKWFWEHWGRMHDENYKNHMETKKAWYNKHFPGQLIESFERPDLTHQIEAVISKAFG